MLANNKFLSLVLPVLAAANIFIWQAAAAGNGGDTLELGFLDVGQGDSQLINFAGVQILIDGGKGPKFLSELPRLMAPGDRYIDIIVATHPDLDHFGGLIDVLKNYGVGAVITNGREGAASAYNDFKKAFLARKIPEIRFSAGDRIKYRDLELETLWPPAGAASGKNSNESGIVLLLKKGDLRALYTADIGFETEDYLRKKHDLDVDILKVAHHGSKFSTNSAFLQEASPAVSAIGVGRNSYGHPTGAVLDRLAGVGSRIFRTDLNGTIKIIFDGEFLKVYSNKSS